MKILFVPAKINLKEINIEKIQNLKLPKSIAIAYSIQYSDIASQIQKILSKKYRITKFIQVLGCSKPKFSKDTQAILLISSGRFHAISLSVETNLPVYLLESDNLKKISDEEINSFKKRNLASYSNFLNSEKIGILVSTKPGQENLEKAISFKNSLKNKKSYIFLGNNLNTKEFENFNIKSWVNTACPRLDLDSSVINLGNLNFSHTKNSF